MEIISIKQAKIKTVVDRLRKGALVIMPTETVYGAFVDATNKKAVKKLNAYKSRPFGKPYSVAVNNIKMAEKYAHINSTAKALYKNFLPGPLTVISKGKGNLAKGVESENKTLGIRIPDYKLILKVVEKLGKPITATAANASYKKRPYKIDDILNNLSEKQKNLIDLIIDAGELPKNEPSTVIDTILDDPITLRLGEIKLKNKNEVVSKSEEATMNIAKELWQKYESHLGTRAIVFALRGKMGVGKTVFTKGLAKALGLKKEILSPTYDLKRDYQLPKSDYQLIHLDMWRVESSEELNDFEFAKSISDKSVIAIEWADRAADEIRKYNEEAVIIWLDIKYHNKPDERLISWGTS